MCIPNFNIQIEPGMYETDLIKKIVLTKNKVNSSKQYAQNIIEHFYEKVIISL